MLPELTLLQLEMRLDLVQVLQQQGYVLRMRLREMFQVSRGTNHAQSG